MQTRKIDTGYIVKLERGENVLETLTTFCAQENIESARFQAIGAVNDVTLGYYDLPTKTYLFNDISGDVEVVSMTGNVALLDGKPFLHVHTVLSDKDMNTYGGHLKTATVAVTLEVFLAPHDARVLRTMDDAIGLNLLNL